MHLQTTPYHPAALAYPPLKLQCLDSFPEEVNAVNDDAQVPFDQRNAKGRTSPAFTAREGAPHWRGA
jgi:hypothetical protein